MFQFLPSIVVENDWIDDEFRAENVRLCTIINNYMQYTVDLWLRVVDKGHLE